MSNNHSEPSGLKPDYLKVLFSVMADSALAYIVGSPYSRHYIDVYDMITNEGSYLMDEADCPMTIREGDVVIDAGAWRGDFSLLAAINFGATAYAFEPSGTNHNMLLRTISLNNCEGSLPIFCGTLKAVSHHRHSRWFSYKKAVG